MNFHSTQMNRHKYVHWMATYRLRVHQFTTEQVGKGDKKKQLSLITQNQCWVSTNMLIQRQLTYWECTSSQYKWVKEIKEGTNFDSTQNEYAQTCSLNGNLQTESGPVHNTVSGQRRNKLSLNTKSMLSMHKDIHSKVTYNLRVHQFPTQQVGKGDKRRNKFSLNTKWVCTNVFIEWQLTVWECTSSEHSKWVKELKKEQIFTQHKMSMHKHVHWMATYSLRVYQFRTQQVGKGGKRRNKFSLNTKRVCTNMFTECQLMSWECTIHNMHSKWVKKGDKRRNEFSINTKWVCTNMLTSFKGN